MNKIPMSMEAERSVLGQIMAGGPTTAGEIIGTLLEGHHFYDAAHRMIFDKLVESYYADEPMDGLSVGERLAPKLAGAWGWARTTRSFAAENWRSGSAMPGTSPTTR